MWKERRRQIERAKYVVVSIAIGVQSGTVSGQTATSLAITRVTVIDTLIVVRHWLAELMRRERIQYQEHFHADLRP